MLNAFSLFALDFLFQLVIALGQGAQAKNADDDADEHEEPQKIN
jgi:hypothetical protein